MGHPRFRLCIRLADLLCDGDGVTIAILEREFPHAIKLVGDWHGNLRARFLDLIEYVLKIVDLNVEGETRADCSGEFRMFRGNGFLVVEKNLDCSVGDGGEDIWRVVRNSH